MVVTERNPLVVSPRRKTAARRGRGPHHQVTHVMTTRKILRTTVRHQANDGAAHGAVREKLIRFTLKASRKAINGEPGAPIP